MKTIFDQRQLAHAPLEELHNGERVPYAENPGRARDILSHLADFAEAIDFGLDPLLAVHDQGYLDLLRDAHRLWRDAGRANDAIAYTFPIVGRRPLNLDRIDARLGQHAFDAATPITESTWESAYWSVQTALTALDSVMAQEARAAFALCRPPGHHAGRDYMGGYCYLNNAAIAAARARALGLGPVAILDVDYHHGNGTQDIFLDDPDMLFVSIHADPRSDYPFFWGHADETGQGQGAGATVNFPLPRGMDFAGYRPVLGRALSHIREWGARFLVLSFGADTFAGDPISHFKLATEDFGSMARDISACGLPVLIVMEGGYAVADLGTNVATFVGEFMTVRR